MTEDSTRPILVTGAASDWGQKVVRRLAGRTGSHIIGLDSEPPAQDAPGLDFVQADIRNPALADLLKSEGVNTVCHLAFVPTTAPSPAAFDYNVKGTMHLLDACAEVGVPHVVLKSSTAVYGAKPTNPAFLHEGHALLGSRHCGYVRDLIEIELFCNGFRLQAPQLMITILRFPNIVGPGADTPMTRFLSTRWAPAVLGYDPRMQVIHEEDVVGALVHALDRPLSGVFNVAAEGILPLNRIRGLSGKRVWALPNQAFIRQGAYGPAAGRWLARHRSMPLDPDFLRFPCVADLERMRRELEFEPVYTAEQALRDSVERRTENRIPQPAQVPRRPSQGRQEQYVRDLIERRRRFRERQVAPTPAAEEDRNG